MGLDDLPSPAWTIAQRKCRSLTLCLRPPPSVTMVERRGRKFAGLNGCDAISTSVFGHFVLIV